MCIKYWQQTNLINQNEADSNALECLVLSFGKVRRLEVSKDRGASIFSVKQSTLLVLIDSKDGGKSIFHKVGIDLPCDTAWRHWRF